MAAPNNSIASRFNPILKPVFVIMVVCMLSGYSAKSQIIIMHDEEGKLLDNLPDKIFDHQKINFQIPQKDESLDKYLMIRNRKIEASLNKLKTLTTEDQEIFQRIYSINSAEIASIISELELALKYPMTKSLNCPIYNETADSIYKIKYPKGIINLALSNGIFSCERTKCELIDNGNSMLDLSLQKRDLYKSMVFQWYAGTSDSYGRTIDLNNINKLNSLVKFSINSIDSLLLNGLNPLSDSLCKLVEELNTMIAASITPLNNKKQWVQKWLWYTGGIPLLNPFSFAADIGNEPDTSDLPTLKIKLAARDSILKKLNYASISVSKVDSIIEERIALSEKISTIEKKYLRYIKNKNENEELIRDFTSTDFVLNNSSFYITPSGNIKCITNEGDAINPAKSIYWMRHHDAANGNEPLNLQDESGYIELDREFIIEHNMQKNEKITFGYKVINIEEDYPAWQPIDELRSLSKVFEIFSFDGAGPACNIDSLIEELRINAKLLDYLAKQSNPKLGLEPRTEKDPVYHSQVLSTVRRIKGPKTYQYWIKSSTAPENQPADTFQFRINKLYRFMPFAGVAVSYKKFRDANLNESKTAVTSIDSNYVVSFFLGLKVYPLRRINIQSPKFVFSKDERGNCLFASRFNLQFGVALPDPLENIFLGAGLDLYPGFNLSAGYMLNRYTLYEFQDGAVNTKNNQYRGSAYAGLSTDLVLFAELIKFMGLNK